jgi:type IV secretory pathway protease TraF
MKVSGSSLDPVYMNGDFVMVSKIPILLFGIAVGDFVVFDHPRYGRLIKRVERVTAAGKRLFVVGENTDSVDSRTFGSIPREWVQARVIWHFHARD